MEAKWWEASDRVMFVLPYKGDWGEMFIAYRFRKDKQKWQFALVHRLAGKFFLLGFLQEGVLIKCE